MTERDDALKGVRELRQLVLDHSVMVKLDGETSVPRVSVHFFGVQQVGELTAHDLAESIKGAERGWYGDVTPERIMQGPSYIELGAWIGDQGDAMRLMGLGELVGLWKVFTPGTMGIDGAAADTAAGSGYVLILPTETTKQEMTT